MTDDNIIRLAYAHVPEGQWDSECLKRYILGFVQGFKACLKRVQEALDE